MGLIIPRDDTNMKQDIREVVNDERWQRIRRSFLGTWKRTPVANIKFLKWYLGNMSDERRNRQVHNYLTGSAFRLKIIKHPEIDVLLRKLRNRPQLRKIRYHQTFY